VRAVPENGQALSAAEREAVLTLINTQAYADLAIGQIWARELDEGRYWCSASTMYRVARAAGQSRERRRLASHPAKVKPELLADGPSQVWIGLPMITGTGKNRAVATHETVSCHHPPRWTRGLRGVSQQPDRKGRDISDKGRAKLRSNRPDKRRTLWYLLETTPTGVILHRWFSLIVASGPILHY